MTTFLIGILIGLAGYLWMQLDNDWTQKRLSPDGSFYLKCVSQRQSQPRTYARRWLLPMICRSSYRSWQTMQCLSLVLTTGILCTMNVWYGVLFLSLPALTRFNITLPVLVDQAALCFAVGAVWAMMHEQYLVCAVLAILAGASHERAPIFAAAWSIAVAPFPLCMIPLVGLLGPAWFAGRKVCATDPIWLQNPIKEALKTHRGQFGSWVHALLPWGGMAIMVPLGFQTGTATTSIIISTMLSIGLGYGQLLTAQDSARLYCWAFLPMLLMIPESVLPFSIICLFNPYRGV